jgi:Rubredoxin-like zinc ribbon domain (DUF35_N)
VSDQASRFRIVGGTDTDEQPPELKGGRCRECGTFYEPGTLICPNCKASLVAKPKKPRAKRPPLKDQMRAFKCTPCSEEVGNDQHKLVQVMMQPFEANGKIVAGGLWWACARCLKPYFMIRLYGVDKK